MAQYQIPQFVDLEDRIIGPLTLKQFLYLGGGGGLLLLNWFVFNFTLWLILAIPIVAIAVAFAFLKINGRPFMYFVTSFFIYIFRPRLYVWTQKPEERRKAEERATTPKVEAAAPVEEEKVSRSRLKELALNLDIAAKRKSNQE